ncbi:MAG: hypothetical protein P8N72_14345 [Flavimaricola sp.]|nr:hypothetical protein [Flavimaricola sp.]
MSNLRLTKTQILEGTWEGLLSDGRVGAEPPLLKVLHMGLEVEGVTIGSAQDGLGWHLRVPIPIKALSDGVQTFVVVDEKTGDTLDSFTILAGEALAEDIRAEIDLLRAELDMLKKAFRRHCIETMG